MEGGGGRRRGEGKGGDALGCKREKKRRWKELQTEAQVRLGGGRDRQNEWRERGERTAEGVDKQGVAIHLIESIKARSNTWDGMSTGC